MLGSCVVVVKVQTEILLRIYGGLWLDPSWTAQAPKALHAAERSGLQVLCADMKDLFLS